MLSQHLVRGQAKSRVVRPDVLPERPSSDIIADEQHVGTSIYWGVVFHFFLEKLNICKGASVPK